MKKKISILLLLLALNTRGAVVSGKLLDILGATNSPIITFTPQSTPLIGGGSIVLDVTRNVRPTNGTFSTTLMGGLYTVTFGSGGKSIEIACPADANSYYFTNLANLATFDYPNVYGAISARVIGGDGLITITNNAGAYNETVTFDFDSSQINTLPASVITNVFYGSVLLSSNVSIFNASLSLGWTPTNAVLSIQRPTNGYFILFASWTNLTATNISGNLSGVTDSETYKLNLILH